MIGVSTVVSILASSYLLRTLRLVRVEHSQKLMSRQLWHLAMADLGVCCFFFVQIGVSFFGRSLQEQTYLDVTCKVIAGLELAFFSTSSAVEVHLALSLLATIFRSTFGVRVLGQLLCAVWLAGLVLGVLGTNVEALHFSHSVGCEREKANVVFIAVSVLSVVICTISYLVCVAFLRRRQCVGFSVERRFWTRTKFYVLAWLICILPDTVRTIVPTGGGNLLEDNFILHTVSLVLFSLNGTANTLIYMVQTGYLRRIGFRSRSRPLSRRLAHRSFSVRDIGSFNVAVGGVSVRWACPSETTPTPCPSEILETTPMPCPAAEPE